MGVDWIARRGWWLGRRELRGGLVQEAPEEMKEEGLLLLALLEREVECGGGDEREV